MHIKQYTPTFSCFDLYYYPRFIVPYRLYTIRIGSIIIRGLLCLIDFILYVSADTNLVVFKQLHFLK